MLFDFKAAFPCVAHPFLISSLEAIGLPPHAFHFIKALYDNNRCVMSFQGNVYKGFDMECGVRQCCPISPLLFAASIDILLRYIILNLEKIEDTSEDGAVRGAIKAFADDIGAVIEDWDRDGPKLEAIFREFAIMSGLEFNNPKTVAIPLWDEPLPDIKQTLGISMPAWRTSRSRARAHILASLWVRAALETRGIRP